MTSDNGRLKASIMPWVGLGILIVFSLWSFLDKQMFGLLLTQIADSLQLSDTKMGTLQGVAFSLTYSTGVLLTGWLVDRYSPRLVIFWGVMFWSLSAAASGLANSFGSMFLARAGVGLGEAALMPAAFALMAALLPRDKLSFATGAFNLGNNLGGIVAFLFGGQVIASLVSHGGITLPVVGHVLPWQAAFIATGLPGVLLAFLIFAVPWNKPDRSAGSRYSAENTSWAAFGAFVRQNARLVVGHIMAAGFLGTMTYAVISWSATFLVRTFDWTPAEVGAVLALGVGCGGVANLVLGALCDYLRRRGVLDSIHWVYIASTLIGIPLTYLTFVVAKGWIVVPLYALVWMVPNSWGAFNSAPLLIAPSHFHGKIIAVQTTVVGIMGLGFAPLLVGVITDYVFHDKSQVGHSISLATAVCGTIAIGLTLIARTRMADAVRAVEAATPAKA